MSEQKLIGLVILMPAMGGDGKPTEAQVDFQKALSKLFSTNDGDADAIVNHMNVYCAAMYNAVERIIGSEMMDTWIRLMLKNATAMNGGEVDMTRPN